MNYAKINPCDIANGPGVRVSLFVSGCSIHCPGCHNQEAWDFKYGNSYTPEVQKRLLDLVDRPYIRGLTILGGEPLDRENIHDVCDLLWEFRCRFGNQKDIWLYSGYTFSDIFGQASCPPFGWSAFNRLDVLVDGPFIEAQKDPTLVFRGSKNQRIIDVRKTLKQRNASTVILWEPEIRRIDHAE